MHLGLHNQLVRKPTVIYLRKFPETFRWKYPEIPPPSNIKFSETRNPTTPQCADRPRAGLWAAPHRRPGQPISLEVPPSATRSRGPSAAVPLAVRRPAVLRRQRHACLEHVAVVAERVLAAGGRISAAVAAVRRFPCSGAVRPAARPGGPLRRRRTCLRVAVVQPSL